MKRNACNRILLALAVTGCLAACNHTPTRPDTRTLHEFAYLPIKAHTSLELEFAGTPLPDAVQDACREYAPSAVGLLFLEWLAERIVSGVKSRVEKEIALYSSELDTPKTYGAFYDPEFWRPGDDAQISCFVAVSRSCEVAADNNHTHCESKDSINFLLVGQYRRTEQYLQLRPLWAGIKGMPGKFQVGAPASMTMKLTLNTDWHTNSSGIRSTAKEFALYQVKFKASQNAQELPVKSAVWSELPYLPLPARSKSIDDNGHVAPVLSLVSASLPPRGVSWLQSFLDDKGKSLSKELKSSLEDLLE